MFRPFYRLLRGGSKSSECRNFLTSNQSLNPDDWFVHDFYLGKSCGHDDGQKLD